MDKITPYQVRILENIMKLNSNNPSIEWAVISQVLYVLAKQHMSED